MGNAATGSEREIPAREIASYLRSAKECFDQKLRNPTRNNAALSDFEVKSKLAKGRFGIVYLVKKKRNNVLYAMKLIPKESLSTPEDLKQIVNERNILQAVDFPFIMSYDSCFKTNAYLHITMIYASGGTLLDLMLDLKTMNEDDAKFYAGQIVLALQYLHGLDIVFCNLKLDNLVLDGFGYLRLIDFGLAKVMQGRNLYVFGATSYMAPEMLLRRGYNKSADWWAFGVVLYAMIAGEFPFTKENEIQKITECEFNFSRKFSSHSKHLLSTLMIKDASNRFGTPQNEAVDIKRHPWFFNTNWLKLFHKEVESPMCPVSPHFSSTEKFIAFDRKDFEEEQEDLSDRFDMF